jgi:hypothetical protein
MVVVHAIFIAKNIEFSRLTGDYLPAKFELYILNLNYSCKSKTAP